jgi:hypothetical protein
VKGLSNRQIAAAVGADHKTVAADLRGENSPKSGENSPSLEVSKEDILLAAKEIRGERQGAKKEARVARAKLRSVPSRRSYLTRNTALSMPIRPGALSRGRGKPGWIARPTIIIRPLASMLFIVSTLLLYALMTARYFFGLRRLCFRRRFT